MFASLPAEEAERYAGWFGCLAEPTRVRLLHEVANNPAGVSIGRLATALGVGQPTVSHHVRKLTEIGFVEVFKDGTSSVVMVDPNCRTALPQATDAVMGVLSGRLDFLDAPTPDEVAVRAMEDKDWGAVRHIHGASTATKIAMLTTEVADEKTLDALWLPDHRWVAEIDGTVAGWAALAPVSEQECYRGVAEVRLCVADSMRGRGVGRMLMRTLVIAADKAGLWTLQNTVFPENRLSIALHHWAGFRTVGVRERCALLDGQWHDTVILERRTDATTQQDTD